MISAYKGQPCVISMSARRSTCCCVRARRARLAMGRYVIKSSIGSARFGTGGAASITAMIVYTSIFEHVPTELGT